MKRPPFYIGWEDKPAGGYKKYRLHGFALFALFTQLFLFLLIRTEPPFLASWNRIGKTSTLEGYLVDYPVPAIRIDTNGRERTVPLVGFGKMGASAVTEMFRSLDKTGPGGYRVVLEGTLFGLQDHLWMELTGGQKSLLSVEPAFGKPLKSTDFGEAQVLGEIVDPKCFFGMMNPAFGTIHRSCAVRCLSGRIPPLLVVGSPRYPEDFYFLADQDGKLLEGGLDRLVGRPMLAKGRLIGAGDLKILKVDISDPGSLCPLLGGTLRDDLSYCYGS